MNTGNLILLLILQCSLIAKSFADQSQGDLLESIIEARKLRSEGYHDFEHSTIYEVNESKMKQPVNGMSIRTKRGTGKAFNLQFTAFGEVFNLQLFHTVSVLHPDAKIVVEKDNTVTEWKGKHPDCFLTGNVLSHGGTVSASYCDDNMIGGLTTQNHTLHFENIPTHTPNDDKEEHTVILIARKPLEARTDPIPLEIKTKHQKKHSRHRRAIQSTSFDLEMAVYTDADFTALFPTTDTAKRTEIMVLRYNGVQMEWSRVDMLGFNVTIQIKYMHFYESDPAGYNKTGLLMTTRLSSFCSLKQGTLPFDTFYLHIGQQGLDVSGRAYLGSICKQSSNCACDNVQSGTGYIATSHEIGHNFGMGHDADVCPLAAPGNMGGYGAGWSTCSASSMNNFITSNNVSCLWEVNIPSSDVPTSLQGLVLESEIVGQLYTPDEVCEEKYGTGFRYREFPLLDVCSQYSCVNYNQGPTFGQMFFESTNIPGQYCDTGKICFKLSCVTWATAKQADLTVRAGAWGDWGSWTYSSCSRTCGTGVQFRRRKCDNPTPKNSPNCEGEEYDASPCNTTPCPGDSSSVSTLKSARASEVCASLITSGVINGTMYQSTGEIYSYSKYGQCEVSCHPVAGYTTPSFTRFGLAPDGTPCTGTLGDWDSNDWPRRPGYYYMCIQGFCKRFGCDKLEGATYDECGVCGGDNSTCDVYTGVDNLQQAVGTYRVLVILPEGAYNIQFWFTYPLMKQNFLEVWTGDDKYVLADSITYTFSYPDPVSFAGTLWYYSYTYQYLYAKGPMNTSAVIKIFKKKDFNNIGINYAYSVPKSGNTCGNCSKVCANNGTLVDCPCSCQCNERSYGATCTSCKYPYEGAGCSTCKVNSCLNNGTFDANTCRCNCLIGYGGLQCESICQDTSSTCAADVAAGKCESDNINMEQNCMASCDLCGKTCGNCSKVCANGGTLVDCPCSCQCNERSYGATCTSCKYPYEGADCSTCKVNSCLNNGTFDANTCRCNCLVGYGGLQCESICQDSSSTCAADVAAGKCESDNINMEQNCMASCDLCVPIKGGEGGSSLSKLSVDLLLWSLIAYLLSVV